LQLVFLLAFCVAAMGTYFNMLPLPRLETKQKSFVDLVHFKISMALSKILKSVLQKFYKKIRIANACLSVEGEEPAE